MPKPYLTLDAIYCREADQRYAVAPHHHSGYQWYLVLDGTVIMTIDGREVNLKANDSIIIPPDATRGPRTGGGSCRYLYAVFEAPTLDLEEASRVRLKTPRSLVGDQNALVEEVSEGGGINTEALVHALTLRLIIGLTRGVSNSIKPARSNSASTHHQGLVCQVESFLRHNLHRPISREEMARIANISSPHLGRIFQQIRNCSPIERLQELRMERARRLLITSTLPATRIALEVGCASFSHFSKLFKRYSQQSPGEYRRTSRI
ncbi:MAG: helix-turn-helix domain-containing protein [Planctomycetota bacterium]|jgi:AraC-like DNA-binding protein